MNIPVTVGAEVGRVGTYGWMIHVLWGGGVTMHWTCNMQLYCITITASCYSVMQKFWIQRKPLFRPGMLLDVWVRTGVCFIEWHSLFIWVGHLTFQTDELLLWQSVCHLSLLFIFAQTAPPSVLDRFQVWLILWMWQPWLRPIPGPQKLS